MGGNMRECGAVKISNVVMACHCYYDAFERRRNRQHPRVGLQVAARVAHGRSKYAMSRRRAKVCAVAACALGDLQCMEVAMGVCRPSRAYGSHPRRSVCA